jgi:type IX secretion system substrate protein/HYDIN/CFA65/VesB family protein
MKKLYIFLALAFFLVSYSSLHSEEPQYTNQIWYFGYNAGIDFNNDPPTPLLDGKITADEGCATISDINGDVILYTDGVSVWNKFNLVIDNGTGLFGNSSTAQSALIVPHPGMENYFYIFTIDQYNGTKGFCYSIVNMNENSGNGKVIEKNSFIRNNVAEKLAGTLHSNGQNYWVVVKEKFSNKYYSYLIKSDGLDLSEMVTNSIGDSHSHPDDFPGYLTFSPNGSMIATTRYVTGTYELFKFNNTTGVLSNYIKIDLPQQDFAYGVEFSPNNRYLYATSRHLFGALYQFDLVSWNSNDIKISRVQLYGINQVHYFGAIKLANDGKIYLTISGSEYLGVVNNPNNNGTLCNFVLAGYYMGGKVCNVGLPNYLFQYGVSGYPPPPPPPPPEPNLYCIPDVGAPDMNVYMEIMSPFNPYDATASEKTFGEDGYYFDPASNDISIELVNESDKGSIEFSPPVVSWDGRMISTQVFINPKLTPNSTKWYLLLPKFQIPFRFKNGTEYSAIDTFFVVQPTKLGDISGNPARVFGEGSLGIRSKRGAMVIDSLVLANDVYTVSTDDCDPNLAGNQGYLPFVLLSKGKIEGLGNQTEISVSAPDATLGTPGHAGPGGGGGGGRYVDNDDDEPLDAGGSGFTGGGPGGLNNFFGANVRDDPGVGTGDFGDLNDGGWSINGIPGGTATLAYEAAGGGTGHPFGKSGEGCNDGDNCEPTGQQGGGSGYKQDRPGACGGYATDGGYSGSREQTAGQAHGNVMVVPIAGGSGGASGNPEITGIEYLPLFQSSSGNGGGGGGAIRIFAARTRNLKISADGGDGSTGWKKPTWSAQEPYSGAYGGGGSGGHIGLFSKFTASDIIMSAGGGIGNQDGSKKGGAGRVRADVNFIGNPPLQSDASFFEGFITDTSKYVKRIHKLTGVRINKNQDIEVYIKGESDAFWWKAANPVYTDNAWSVNLYLPKPDSIFYVYAIQAVDEPNTDMFEFEPDYVFSQAAANILRIERAPKLMADTLIDFDFAECTDEIILDSIFIWNEGDADLFLDFENAYFMGYNDGFELLSPKVSMNLAPGDSVELIIRRGNSSYIPSDGYNAFLLISHNDLQYEPYGTILQITINFEIKEFGYEFVDRKTLQSIDTLFLGEVCPDTTLYGQVTVLNTGSMSTFLKRVEIRDAVYFWTSEDKDFFELDVNPPPLDYNLYFKATALGDYYDKIVFGNVDCPEFSDSLVVWTRVVDSKLTFSGQVDFGNVNIDKVVQSKILLVNEGTASVRVESISGFAPPFYLMATNPGLPRTLQPGETIELTVEYRPTIVGTSTAMLSTITIDENNTCDSYAEVELTGTAVDEDIFFEPNPVAFGLIPSCNYKDTLEVKLINAGSSSILILDKVFIQGINKDNFRDVTPVSNSGAFDPGDTLSYLIEFTSNSTDLGLNEAELVQKEGVFGETYTVPLSAMVEEFTYTIVPNPLVFDNGVVNSTVSKSFRITNTSSFDALITSVSSTNTELTFTPNSNIPVAAGGFVDIDCDLYYKADGTVNADINIEIALPCVASEIIKASGQGLIGDYTFSNPIDFGQVLDCEKVFDVFSVSNTGDSDIIIHSIGPIQGTDAGSFGFDGINPILPMTLAPTESYSRDVSFAPAVGFYGPKEAFFVSEIESQGVIADETTRLIANVPEYDIDVGDALAFDAKIIGSTNTLQITIQNNNIWDIEIVNLEPFDFPTIYSVNPDPVGQTIAAGASWTFNIVFEPAAEEQYDDELKLDYKVRTCDASTATLITGNGVPEPEYTLYLRIPDDLYATPNLDSYDIPIYGRIEGGSDFNDGAFSADLNMNYTLFYPNSTDKGTLSHLIDNGNRVISVDLENIALTANEQIIANVNGATMLGNTDVTTITWSNFVWNSSQIVNPTLIDGSLEIEICREGGDRLVKQSSEFELSSTPNPADKIVNLVANSPEKGFHKIQIMNAQGKVLKEISWENSSDNKYEFKKQIDASEFASGMYFAVMKTPNRAKTIIILITK